MFRRLRFFIGLNARSGSAKRLLHARTPRRLQHRQVEPTATMLETVQEIAVYIHRFHNLDLFQQGWYQIKISMRWEDSSNGLSHGTPARVVQYEAPDLGSDDIMGVWRIDDVDHSFSTQPFRIKYARQDVLLSVMISFNLALQQHEGPSTSAVILKFELLYAPILENGSELQESLDAFPASVHEFRVPPKALLGLHSYCPVYFDTFHAVLVDLSVHIVLLKAGTYTPSQKVFSDSCTEEDVSSENYEASDHIFGQGSYRGSKAMTLIKALSTARDILLEELQKLSKAIDQTIDDLTDVKSTFGGDKLIDSYLRSDMGNTDDEGSETRIGGRQLTSESQSGLEEEKLNRMVDFGSDGILQVLSKEALLDAFHSLGNQLLFIWNAFLKFHRLALFCINSLLFNFYPSLRQKRTNRARILEFLRDVWANDRKAEWSIWMVHSRIEVPHRYLRSAVDEASHHSVLGRVSLPRKSSDDPTQTAVTRAELHRRSIGQMKINNRSIQDMQIFADPSRIPVILVEQHVMNAPLRTTSHNSSIGPLDQKDMSTTPTGPEGKVVPKLLGAGPQKSGRVLRAVIFVHGFQGHHLDLRLVRNQWLLIDPGAECLMSEANEDKTSGDFREMGGRLAEEVTSFLKKKMDKASRSGGYRNIKLSFVGHSIGNVIIRSALTESVMVPYVKYLYTYMSVSGPHLGYLYSSNSLFNSGLWLLKKLKGTQCIHQLTFTDDPDLQNTFFYKLCKQKTLEYFNNIILISSPQDGYVPYHSARIELCPAAALDYSKKGQLFMEMLNNCLDQIRALSSEKRTFMRCDVNFDTSSQGRSLNTIIGRAAHIEFLEADIFAKFIMWSFTEFFC
ncbi:uncharacterized protein LOC131235214 [Magnolia sinica]|uniref:uncharacterized protein LOC131235214 n=1 Tax=Magnolia sinica TaxID=86752 RepID=UPI00265B689D|nr:uncharacterized protein LOC131235214 [Magnolia sinica]